MSTYLWPPERNARWARIIGISLLAFIAALDVFMLWVTPTFLVVLAPEVPLLWLSVVLIRSPRSGLQFRAVRGPGVEVRPRLGGDGLLVETSGVEFHASWMQYATRRAVSEVAWTMKTNVGNVMFARGFDNDLQAWIATVPKSTDAPTAPPLNEIAANAKLDAPPAGFHVDMNGPWPRIQFRAFMPNSRGMLWVTLIALLLPFLLPVIDPEDASMKVLTLLLLGPLLGVSYLLALAGPLDVVWDLKCPMLWMRYRRWGLTLWKRPWNADHLGLYLVELPSVGLRFGESLTSFTSPAIGGPDVYGMVWLAAVLRNKADSIRYL